MEVQLICEITNNLPLPHESLLDPINISSPWARPLLRYQTTIKSTRAFNSTESCTNLYTESSYHTLYSTRVPTVHAICYRLLSTVLSHTTKSSLTPSEPCQLQSCSHSINICVSFHLTRPWVHHSAHSFALPNVLSALNYMMERFKKGVCFNQGI